jgi:hypothetical protein
MGTRRKYAKRAGALVVAIPLDLDTRGFTYRKWGGEQICKAGDWIVNNGGDIYTVDRDTFARTYRAESPGLYRKVAPVWAEVADRDGAIQTKEGVTHYRAGDYLVFNDEQGQDGYAVTSASFEAMYESAE